MEVITNSLLMEQVREHFGSMENLSDELKRFILDIDQTYQNFAEKVQLLQDANEENNLTEEALVNERYLMSSLMNNIPDHIYFKDIQSRFIRINKSHAESFGLTDPKQAIGKSDADFFTSDHANKAFADEQEIIRTGQPVGKEERQTWNGRPDSWVATTKIPLRDKNRNIIGTFGISKDITKRKQAEETLHNERALFRTIIDLIPDAVYVKDMAGRKTLANPKEVQLSGKNSEDEIIGQTDFYLYPDSAAKRGFDEDQLVLNSGIPILDIEGSLVDNQNLEHWLLISKVPLRGTNGNITGLVGISREITEQKNIEIALLKAKQEAEHANKAKSEFLANMSHEIRTPLNGVIGFTDLLHKTPLNRIQQQYVENINSSGLTLLSIINDILDFSKIEAGKMELDFIKTDLIEQVEMASDIIKYHAAQKGLELLLNIPQNLPRFAVVDPIRLKQILVNLLSNAVKFTTMGEVELKVSFTKIDTLTGRFNFAIRDTGIGINLEQQKKLFKAFTQADSSTTRKFGGTGLGLVISSMLADKMGSTIEIFSEPGKGSTFSFTLETQYEQGEKIHPGSLTNINRILVIDDNDNNRMILEHTFNNWGIAFVGIDNGLAALQVIEHSKPFDLIIVDYHMPYFNGMDTIRMIRQQLKLSPEIQPIILLHSSSDDIEIYDECKKLGVRYNITKPVKSEELLHYLINLQQPQPFALKENEVVPGRTAIELENHPSVTILVTEDVPINMILVTTIISQMLPEAIIVEARNGMEAVEKAITCKPDLIFMDVQMPEMGGIEATLAIRNHETEENCRVPIVALTAGVVKGEKENCFRAGMDDFLTKPIMQKALREVLVKFLSKLKGVPIPNVAVVDIQDNEPHFDSKQLMENIGHSDIVFGELVEEIPGQLSADMALLQHSIFENDLSQIKKSIHTIVGVSLGMCFKRLGRLAKELEMCALNSESEKLAGHFQEMTLEWEHILSILKNKGIDHLPNNINELVIKE